MAEGTRRLATLGFIEILDEDHLRLRSPLLRFADPVRGLSDICVAMERLIAKGEIVDLAAEDSAEAEGGDLEENSDEDDENGVEEDDDEEPQA